MKAFLRFAAACILIAGGTWGHGGARAGEGGTKRVVVVTGIDHPAHLWRETAPALADVLRGDGRLRVDVVEDPNFLASPQLATYDAIVLHFMNWERPDPGRRARTNLRACVAAGKGLVLVHFACGAFQGWDEFARLAGRVWDPNLRPHDPRGPFEVKMVAPAHPITQGLSGFATDDELYTCLTGDAPIEVLATARSKVDERDYPMTFVLNYRQGRVFHCVLGHDVKALANRPVAELYRRGTAWVTGLAPHADAAARVFDVRQFGAKGDGEAFDTEAIQKALDQCGKAGGGVVRFARGTYLSQPITLRARTTIELDGGAKLQATGNQVDFMKTPGDWLSATSGSDFVPFISGKDLTDVRITGAGTIDGNGRVWWPAAEEARRQKSGYTLPRPNLIILTRCRNVTITGVTIQNAPKFHLVPTDCEDVLIEGVTFKAPADAPNTDAIDPSVSRRVRISRCVIDVGDDNVAIKSGKKMEGREFACEDITVSDCVFLHGHGVSIGSETVGGVRNVTVERCTFRGTENGIRIKSPRGRGGTIDGLRCRDITMIDVDPALTISAYYPKIPAEDEAAPVTPQTPIIRNIEITNLTATCPKEAGVVIGLPESLATNVSLTNVTISAQTGLTIRNAKGVRLANVRIQTQQGPPVIVQSAEVEGLPATE